MFKPFHPIVINSTGGYNGDKDGYEIPAGTDVFLSVSLQFFTFTFDDSFSQSI